MSDIEKIRRAARAYGIPLSDEAIGRLLKAQHPCEGGRPRHPSQVIRAIALAAAGIEQARREGQA
jgi:hypothetical protein